jgi:hypothetical protein
VILGCSALVAYLAYTLASPVVPGPVAAAVATPFGIVGAALAFGRRDGVSGDRLALFAARYLARPRRRVLAPEGVPQPTRSPVAALELPVRSVLRSGIIELEGGAFCVLLQASGTTFALRSDEEQAGLVDAFARFLNGLTEPVQIVVRSELLDLGSRADALEAGSGRLPHPALAEAARGHARFLRQLASGDEVRRRAILLVLSARADDRQAAGTVLASRTGEATDLLAGAGITLRALDGEQAAALLARALDPPGPPAGAFLEGVVRAC